MTQPFLIASGVWMPIKDANPTGLAIFKRHYSYKPYRDGRRPQHFVGPGEKLVLLTPDARALFVWRKFISGDGQQGVNCAVFRNEGAGLSSFLIQAACDLAWERWPGSRLYTYVNSGKVRSVNPGYCFKMAGWRKCGVTKWNKLLIFEYSPHIRDLARCDREIAEALKQFNAPAWLVTLGVEDWEAEKRLLLGTLKTREDQ